ncbi:MAG: ATP-binding protein [Desulfuromonadales bacterium]|nr:ATP-binding protein [Desulfuromonadales bacterium]
MLIRNITPQIIEALSDTPVVMLNGARQTGKSTLAKSLISEKHIGRYVTLDDATALAAARHDPAGFISGLGESIVIDEIQRAPELFVAIKADVDRNRKPGRFLLTGSANVLLLPRLSESLAGRMELFTLWPLSQGEFAGTRERFIDNIFSEVLPSGESISTDTKTTVIERAIRGGYPEAAARGSESRRRAWFGSYITTILQRDVRDIANIDGLTAMPRLLSMLATRSPSLFNYSELSRTTGLPQSTLKRYMALFETIFLIDHLPAWYSNLGKRLVKTSKLVMNDTGLLTTLLAVDAARLENTPLCGAVIENFVIMELKKQISWSDTRPAMLHYRTQTGQEVDIVLEDTAGRLVGIEIKSAKSVGRQDFRGLQSLAEAAGNNFLRGIVLYSGSEMVSFGSNLFAIPIDSLWVKSDE